MHACMLVFIAPMLVCLFTQLQVGGDRQLLLRMYMTNNGCCYHLSSAELYVIPKHLCTYIVRTSNDGVGDKTKYFVCVIVLINRGMTRVTVGQLDGVNYGYFSRKKTDSSRPPIIGLEIEKTTTYFFTRL